MKTFPCLGFESLGQCQYNPCDPTVYFSIGQLITLVAIAIAFYQILNPIIKLRITSSRWFKFLKPLIILAVSFIFIANMIPSICLKHQATPLLGYPIFWELLSGLIFVSVSWYLVTSIIKYAKIRDNNINVWFDSALDIIDRNEDKQLIDLAKEITPSLSKITSIYKDYVESYKKMEDIYYKKYISDNSGNNENKHNSWKIFQQIKNDKDFQKETQLTSTQKKYFRFIKILSDKSFCKVVACKAPGFSEKFFKLFSSIDVCPGSYIQIANNILLASFNHEESTLNRENQYDGLSHIKSLTLSIFRNPDLLKKPRLLHCLSDVHFKEDWQIKLYFSCLQMAMEVSFKVPYKETNDGSEIIQQGPYEILEKIYDAISSCGSIYDRIPKTVSHDKKMNLLNTISFEIKELLHMLRHNSDKIKDFSICFYNIIPQPLTLHIKSPNKISLYHVLAKVIFDFFETLSRVKAENDFDLFKIRRLGLNLFPFSIDYSDMEKLYDLLIKYIKINIDENSFKNRFYIPITRYMLLLSGLNYPKEKESKRDDLFIYILDKLKKEFHKFYISEPRLALDMLPSNFSYDPKSKVITYHPSSWREKEITLQCE